MLAGTHGRACRPTLYTQNERDMAEGNEKHPAGTWAGQAALTRSSTRAGGQLNGLINLGKSEVMTMLGAAAWARASWRLSFCKTLCGLGAPAPSPPPSCTRPRSTTLATYNSVSRDTRSGSTILPRRVDVSACGAAWGFGARLMSAIRTPCRRRARESPAVSA